MAAPVLGTSVPVWLSEEDLGCIICRELLDWPTTLPCGHSFCQRCLNGLWVTQQRAGMEGRPWACPTCRECPEAKPKLRKNLLLQDLADKYRRAALELEAGPETAPAPRAPSRPALPPVTVQKSTTEEVIQELTELVQRLVDVVKSLQTPRQRSGSGLDSELSILGMALSSGRKYWEVDTRNCNHWAVGVASWGMKRTQMLGRTKDSWCIEWKGPGQFSAWATEKKTDLHLGRPEVVGVWLDLELGKLAFYSVSDQERLLYECEVSVSSPLHPAFWLYGLSPGNYLEIKQATSGLE